MKFTIITAVYNGENTLERAMRSVLEQERGDFEFEYIIVDGASTDRTAEIVRKYEGRLARFVSEPDRGMYDAMNKGIAMATGEWVGILNADDWYEADTLAQVAREVELHPEAELVHCDLTMWKGPGKYVQHGNPDGQIRGCRMTMHHPGSFVKKSVYDRIGGYDIRYKLAADFDFVFRCRDENVRMLYLPRTLVNMTFGGRGKQEYLCSLRETRMIAERHGISPLICKIEYCKSIWKARIKKLIRY